MKRFEAVYSYKMTKAKRNFMDGFIEIAQLENSKYAVKLLNEDECVIERTTISELPPLDGSDFMVGAARVEVVSGDVVESCEEDERSVFKSPNRSFVPKLAEKKVVNVEIRNTHASAIRENPRTVDEVIELFRNAVDEAKHDEETIKANLSSFLE